MEVELLNLLIESIKKTNIEYYKRADGSLLERPFCYELYHQFRLLQGSHCSLILSGEPSKSLSFYMNKGKYPAPETDKDRIYPDFILHKALNDIDSQNQIMAIEVKRKENICNLKDDIDKLQRLVDTDGLQFKLGVFIAIGMTREELKQALEDLEKKEPSIFKKPMIQHVYFIGVESVVRQARNELDLYFNYSPKD